MKKLSKLLVVGLLVLVIFMSQLGSVEAASQSELTDLVEEEMTAEYLYSELYKKYPGNRLFFNLAASEQRHINALKRALSKMGISTEGVMIQDIEIPETKEEALAFALAFEKEDIDMLNHLLESVEDSRLKRVLGNLLKGSTRHYMALEKAIEEGIDNLPCNQDRGRQNKGQRSGQSSGQRRGYMPKSRGWGSK